jgi:hypothetical protein
MGARPCPEARVLINGRVSCPRNGLGCLGARVCWRGEDKARLLLCDGCDGEYHCYCVEPPILEVCTHAADTHTRARRCWVHCCGLYCGVVVCRAGRADLKRGCHVYLL